MSLLSVCKNPMPPGPDSIRLALRLASSLLAFRRPDRSAELWCKSTLLNQLWARRCAHHLPGAPRPPATGLRAILNPPAPGWCCWTPWHPQNLHHFIVARRPWSKVCRGMPSRLKVDLVLVACGMAGERPRAAGEPHRPKLSSYGRAPGWLARNKQDLVDPPPAVSLQKQADADLLEEHGLNARPDRFGRCKAPGGCLTVLTRLAPSCPRPLPLFPGDNSQAISPTQLLLAELDSRSKGASPTRAEEVPHSVAVQVVADRFEGWQVAPPVLATVLVSESMPERHPDPGIGRVDAQGDSGTGRPALSGWRRSSTGRFYSGSWFVRWCQLAGASALALAELGYSGD